METFKGTFGDKQFYFKPKQEGAFYIVEPYRQLGLKPFKLTKRKTEDVDGIDKRVWLIPTEENIPQGVRNLELGFSDFIQEKLALTV